VPTGLDAQHRVVGNAHFDGPKTDEFGDPVGPKADNNGGSGTVGPSAGKPQDGLLGSLYSFLGGSGGLGQYGRTSGDSGPVPMMHQDMNGLKNATGAALKANQAQADVAKKIAAGSQPVYDQQAKDVTAIGGAGPAADGRVVRAAR
jgi:hypothetical protein